MNVASPSPSDLAPPPIMPSRESICGRNIYDLLKLSCTGASRKSTQNAFMFIPYKNPAKLSENRLSDSCMSWRCMKFASKSAIPSLNSANWASNASSGLYAAAVEACCELRSEFRDEGRRGVVGLEGIRVREADRER